MTDSPWSDEEAAALLEQRLAGFEPELSLWARHMAARFNGEVYLLGSVLTNPVCRDIDLRIVVADDEMCARYGHVMTPCENVPGWTARVEWEKVGPTQRQIDDTAKFTAYLSKKFQHNVDVQVVPRSWWHDDIYPLPRLLAAPSPRWWFYSNLHPDEVRVPSGEYFELVKLRDAARAAAPRPEPDHE